MNTGFYAEAVRSPRLRAAGVRMLLWLMIAPAAAEGSRETYDRLNARMTAEQREKSFNNLAGDLAWTVSYQLDACVEMFLATEETRYLDDLVALADRVFAARADATGELDYAGRLGKGWPTNHHYTYGTTVTLLTPDGLPALAVATCDHGDNNRTTIEVLRSGRPECFSLRIRNDARRERPYERIHENLTMSTVEQAVNPPPGERAVVRVRRLGNAAPAGCPPFTPPTAKIIVHGHHTGRILTGILRFCALDRQGKLPAAFHEDAVRFLAAATESMREHDHDWVDEGDAGYTVLEKGAPLWADGFPEPFNTLVCSGAAYLYLHIATGDPHWLDRALRVARQLRAGLVRQPDDSWLLHYWFGRARTGFVPADGISINTPLWPGEDDVEQIINYMLSLQFMLHCAEQGIGFAEADLRPWLNNFHKRCFVPGAPAGTFRAAIDGSGDAEPGQESGALYGWIGLGRRLDPGIVESCRAVLRERYAEQPTGAILYSWAALARADATGTAAGGRP